MLYPQVPLFSRPTRSSAPRRWGPRSIPSRTRTRWSCAGPQPADPASSGPDEAAVEAVLRAFPVADFLTRWRPRPRIAATGLRQGDAPCVADIAIAGHLGVPRVLTGWTPPPGRSSMTLDCGFRD